MCGICRPLSSALPEGIAPSVREIGEAVGLRSTSSVQYNLNALEQAGYITRDANLKRTVRVVGAAKGVNHIPLVGTVTAGMPILATEIIEDYIAVSGVAEIIFLHSELRASQ